MLILVMLTALPMGWVGLQKKRIRDRHEAIAWLRQSTSGIRHGCWEAQGGPDNGRRPWKETYAPWSLGFFGERGMRWPC